MAFPQDFVWGAATSAYQIEGAAAEDGRGASVWDEFCKKPGAIRNGDSAEQACDHYHRFADDVRLMRDLGLQAYRFSIAWPRVLPQGTGAVNPQGLDFYDRLVDALLAAGITPWATLFHWDYPLSLHRRGGWLHRDSAQWFADYAAVVVDRLSDRVGCWFTLNEPEVYAGCGYQQGVHAPGEPLPFDRVLAVCHNLLRGHGMAVQTIRSRAKTKPRIGCALAPSPVPMPVSSDAADIAAARCAFVRIAKKDCMHSVWWADPMLHGRYPEDGLRLFADDMPRIAAEDMEVIAAPIDFIGLNIYFGRLVRAGHDGIAQAVALAPDHERTGFDWPVTPASLYWGPTFFFERYGLPLIISENGAAYPDHVAGDGRVHDYKRIEFLRSYLSALRQACADGVDVRGYFLWSLLDNFEWAAGYSRRFGIVYVDFAAQQRTMKDSAFWYRDVIASHGAVL